MLRLPKRNWPGQRQIVILPSISDDFRQHHGVTKEIDRRIDLHGYYSEEYEPVVEGPSFDRFESVEEDDPEEEINTVIQDHPNDLGQERNPIFQGRQ